jgi:hypothetical protein
MTRILWHAFAVVAGIIFAMSLAGLTAAGTHSDMLPAWAWAILTLGSLVGIVRYASWYRS